MKLLDKGSWRNGDVEYEKWLCNDLPDLEVTAVGAIVFDEKGKVGITHNTKRGWELPAGHLEAGEVPEEALHREIEEELGVSIKNIKLIGFRKTINNVECINKATGKPYPKEGAILWYSANLDSMYDISILDNVDDVDDREFVDIDDERLCSKSDIVFVREILRSLQ